MIRLIEKEVTDKFYDIIAKHNNRAWAIDELEWLINTNHFNFVNDDEFDRAHNIIRILRQY